MSCPSDVLTLLRDLQSYYGNMGFLESASPMELLDRVVLPSKKTRAPPAPPAHSAAPTAHSAPGASETSRG